MSRHRLRSCLARALGAAAALATAASLAVPAAAAAGGSRDAPPEDAAGIGVEIPRGAWDTGIPLELRSPSPATPCTILVGAGRAELEEPGRVAPLLEAAAGAGLRVVVRLAEEGWTAPAGPAVPFPADDWIARVRPFVAQAGGRVSAYQVLDTPAARHAPRVYAYLLKRAAVAIRSYRPETMIVSGSIRPGDEAWAREVFAADAAPYLDVLAAGGIEALPAVTGLRDGLAPQAAIWVVDAGVDPAAIRASAARTYLEALAGGATMALFAPDRELGEELAWLRALFPPGLGPATRAVLPFDPAAAMVGGPEEAAGTAPAVRALAFFDVGRRTGIAAYRAAEKEAAPAAGRAGEATARFLLKTPLESLEILDPRTAAAAPIPGRARRGETLYVPLRDDYLLLRYRLQASERPVQESVLIGAVAELTAEEIIARERQFRAAQDARLRHYEARATIGIHYRIAFLAESVDVVSENRLFVHDGRQDYEQTGLFVDGARWRGRSPPYLPFIQPEKVREVPLDIALDEAYRYALLGRERIEGRDCYRLSFEPAAAGRSLYSGQVCIDARTFARLRMEAVQAGVREPLRSNAVTYRFGSVASPAGDFWLPVSVSGQMVFEVLGQNLVVEREATYNDFAVNQDGFEARLAAAYASGRPLSRETDEGYFRLDHSGAEERLTSLSRPRNTLLLAGASIGLDGDPGLPFAGVNFFDFDFHGSGTQVNLAWAGPFADVSWTDPNLAGVPAGRRPIALTLAGSLNALPRKDKNARAPGTNAGETVEIYSETARADLALPMGHFAKCTLEGRATYLDFTRHDDTDDAFALPPSTTELALQVRLEWNRAGYTAATWGEGARRSAWKPWGLPGAPFDPDDRDYTRLGVELRKQFRFGPFTKVSLGLSGFDGRSLDRFSRFELGDFRSARVRGFNGSGIHFDRGAVAGATYSFSLREALRIDAALEHGWIEGGDDFGPGFERVFGGGLGFQFSGPWSTLVSVRIAHGLSSSIPGKGGGGDVRVVLFRTFDRWWSRPRR